MISLSLMITYIKHCQYSTKDNILDHSTTSRLILKTMMSGVPHHLRKKYTFKHIPSLDLLPHHDPLYPQNHLNPTSPSPTSKRGLRRMQVPIPSSRMKGTTTPTFITSRQLPRQEDSTALRILTSHQDQMHMSNSSLRNNKTFSIQS